MKEWQNISQESQQSIDETVSDAFNSVAAQLEVGLSRDWNAEAQSVDAALELLTAKGDITGAIALVLNVRSLISKEHSAVSAAEESLSALSLQIQASEARRRVTSTTRKGKDTEAFHRQIEAEIARLKERHSAESNQLARLQGKTQELDGRYDYFTRYLFFLKALAAHRVGEPFQNALLVSDPKDEKTALSLMEFLEQKSAFDDERLSAIKPERMGALSDKRGLTIPLSIEERSTRRARRSVSMIALECQKTVDASESSGYPETIAIDSIVLNAACDMLEYPPEDKRHAEALTLLDAYRRHLSEMIKECVRGARPLSDTLSPGARRRYKDILGDINFAFSRAIAGSELALGANDVLVMDPVNKICLGIAEHELYNDGNITAFMVSRAAESVKYADDQIKHGRRFTIDRAPPPSSRARRMELSPLSASLHPFSDEPRFVSALSSVERYYPKIFRESVNAEVERVINKAGGIKAVLQSKTEEQKFNRAIGEHFYEVFSFARYLVHFVLNSRMKTTELTVPRGARGRLFSRLQKDFAARCSVVDKQGSNTKDTSFVEHATEHISSISDRIRFYAYGARIVSAIPDEHGAPKMINFSIGAPLHRALMYLYEEKVMGSMMERCIDRTCDDLRLPSLDFSERAQFVQSIKTAAFAIYLGSGPEERFRMFVEHHIPESGKLGAYFAGPVDLEEFPSSARDAYGILEKFRGMGYGFEEAVERNGRTSDHDSRAWGELFNDIASGELMQFLLDHEE